MPCQLTHVLSLSMPVGLVFSHSFLGGDAFMVALGRDCRQHKLRWETSYSQPGLCETPLSSADLRQLERLKQDGLVMAIPLGEDGMAYELIEQPFRAYAGPILKETRLSLALRESVITEEGD